MQSVVGELLTSVVEIVGRFGDIALASPEQFALIASGALLVGLSSAVFGYLTLGAVLAPLGVSLPSPGTGYRDISEESARARAAPNPAHDEGATGAAKAQRDPYDG